MTESAVIELVAGAVKKAGSMRALAREWNVTPSYLCDLLNGRRAPGPAILGPLGLEKVVKVDYRRNRKEPF